MSHFISRDHLSHNSFQKIGDDLFRTLSFLLLDKLNIHCFPFNDQKPYLFLELNDGEILEIFDSVQKIIDNIQASFETNKNEKHFNKNQLWAYLAANKLKYPLNLFDYIIDGDVIEIYDNENKQVFRSYEFFKHCTFSLDELFSIPWDKLYHRDSEHVDEYMRLLSILKESKSNEVLIVNTVPPHWVSQRHPNRTISHYLQSKVICLIYDLQGNMKGYLHTQRILTPSN